MGFQLYRYLMRHHPARFEGNYESHRSPPLSVFPNFHVSVRVECGGGQPLRAFISLGKAGEGVGVTLLYVGIRGFALVLDSTDAKANSGWRVAIKVAHDLHISLCGDPRRGDQVSYLCIYFKNDR